MAQDPLRLIWIDMEMSGLDPEKERVLEIAVIVTDSELNTVAEAPVLVLHQSNEVLDAMDDWNKSTHGKSGLVDRVKASTLTEAEAEERLVAFLLISCRRALHPCAATRCTRTGVSWPATCRGSKRFFCTAIST